MGRQAFGRLALDDLGCRCTRLLGLAGWLLASMAPPLAALATAAGNPTPVSLTASGFDAAPAAAFERDVAARLTPPPEAISAYAQRLQTALEDAHADTTAAQFVLLVDRSPLVQAAVLYSGSNQAGWTFVGAAPVSTGLPGRYEHFTTPLGVFDHSLANPDFRAEGTKNKLGFRGYGRKGLRVYDFGWTPSPRGWGNGAMGELRLQMHGTDPDLAENRLGSALSEGCVRIPASLNDFIDRYGLLDAAYLQAQADGRALWVLRRDMTPTSSPGRYLVVVDSGATERPVWSPVPKPQ